MNILIVCLDYFPYEGACTNLLNKLFQYGDFEKKIGQINVLTIKKKISDADKEVINNITIYRCLSWRYISNLKKQLFENPIKISMGIFNRCTGIIQGKISNKSFIDAQVYLPVLRKLKKLDAKQFDVIIPVVGNFNAGYAVWRYAKRHKVNYIVYQVDPIATNYQYRNLKKKLLEQFEINLFQNASAIITTPIILKERKRNGRLYSLELPCIHKNVDSREINSENPRMINCIFAGSVYGNIRNPYYTLKLFAKLIESNSKIKLILIGVNEDQIPEKFKSPNIICKGRLDLKTTERELKEADFLVNIGNIMKNQVPSKIFDYISTGIPIINICKNTDCPTITYLRNYKYKINIFEDDTLFEKQLMSLNYFIKDSLNQRMNFEDIYETYKECTAEYCSEKLSHIILNTAI